MRKVDQDLDALFYDLVGAASLHVGHKADSAGIVFTLRVVQTLPLW